jgi:transglutaminase-like putative cysteine protease
MRIAVRHELSFDLGAAPHAAQHLLLTPAPTPQQRIERWSIEMPGIGKGAAFRDAFGNRAHLVTQTRHDGPVHMVVSGEVETFDCAGVIGRLPYGPVPAVFRWPVARTPDPELLHDLRGSRDRIAVLHELMARIGTGAAAQAQDGQGQSQSAAAAAAPGELTEAFIAAARALGIPARYVTGYRLAEPPATDLHAWAEAWDDGLGWIGFDLTLGLCPIDRHVRLAAGPDMMSTLPIRCVPVWPEMPVETIVVRVL